CLLRVFVRHALRELVGGSHARVARSWLRPLGWRGGLRALRRADQPSRTGGRIEQPFFLVCLVVQIVLVVEQVEVILILVDELCGAGTGEFALRQADWPGGSLFALIIRRLGFGVAVAAAGS